MQNLLLNVVGCVVIALSAQAGTFFGVTDLGSLGGGETHGAGLSSTGSAAGWSSDPAGDLRAFSFSGAMVGLGGGSASQAQGINESGTVAGTVYVNGQAQATIWKDGNPVPLGTLGGSDSYATAINNQGRVVGSASDATGQGRAFVYRPNFTRSEFDAARAGNAVRVAVVSGGPHTPLVSCLVDAVGDRDRDLLDELVALVAARESEL